QDTPYLLLYGNVFFNLPVLVMAAYSGLMSWAILKVVGKICGGLRVGKDVEREGLDLNIHGERVE
ncbi:ammonium Transporter family protein, partial [Neisseria meningitidis 2004085]